MEWRLVKAGSESVGMETTEWDDVYVVTGYIQGSLPAFTELLADRPDLAPRQPHPVHVLARVETFEPERLEDSETWQATVSYKIELRGEQDEQEQTNLELSPLLRPATVFTDSELIEVPTFTWAADGGGYYKYVDGVRTPAHDPPTSFAANEAILNTANGPVSGITTSVPLINFNISKNYNTYPAWILTYADAVNTDAVIIKGLVLNPGHLKVIRPVIADWQTEIVSGVSIGYHTVSLTLQYHPYTWMTKILNRGFMQYSGVYHIPCVDHNGEPVTEPAFLDVNGAQINPDGENKIDPAEIITIEGWRQRRLPFNGALPLP